VVGVGLGGVPRGTTVTGHNPCRVGQAADQASEVGQADAGTTADSSDLKAAHRVPVAERVIPRCQHRSLTAILPDRLHHTHSCGKDSPRCCSRPGLGHDHAHLRQLQQTVTAIQHRHRRWFLSRSARAHGRPSPVEAASSNSSSQATFTPRNTTMVSRTASTRRGRAELPRSATTPGAIATTAIRAYRSTAAT
jgi:hypothetical protein